MDPIPKEYRWHPSFMEPILYITLAQLHTQLGQLTPIIVCPSYSDIDVTNVICPRVGIP
jgi:hypothetical protein